MKTRPEEISVAEYNEILMRDAKAWLESAVMELREAVGYADSAKMSVAKAAEKLEQLRLKV